MTYFGGKSKIAPIIWDLLGNPAHYLEPFAGSCAVLLGRPGWDKLPINFAETINDKDCTIANVWRALKYDPDGTADYADDIVCHVDLIAKKKYINNNYYSLAEKMKLDPEYFDIKIAGYYIWAASCWIGAGLVRPTQIPHLGQNGKGINAQIPHLTSNGMGINAQRENLNSWFENLSKRLRKVRIVNGDYKQILGGDWQGHSWNTVGIYFDPPYSDKANRGKKIYTEDSLDIAHEVREYCIKYAKKGFRIVLSGYFDEHQELLENGFKILQWSTQGGYGNTSQDKDVLSAGQKNRKLECLFHVNCINESLFK